MPDNEAAMIERGRKAEMADIATDAAHKVVGDLWEPAQFNVLSVDGRKDFAEHMLWLRALRLRSQTFGKRLWIALGATVGMVSGIGAIVKLLLDLRAGR